MPRTGGQILVNCFIPFISADLAQCDFFRAIVEIFLVMVI